MAKDDDDQQESIDKDSLKFLEDVRKGKARNYVLSTKGGKVRSLIVKKKKIKADDIKSARGGGYQPMFGVVEGQAASITFYIARSDGFEEDPLGGKVIKLKDFLKDQTGKVFKPEVVLVDFPPAIPFDEDDLKDPLIARFMSLAEALQEACERNPDQAESLSNQANEIRGLLQDEETRPQAEPAIGQLEQQLRSLTGSAEPENVQSEQAPPQETGQPDQMGDQVLAGKLAALLAKLKPLYKLAVEKAPDRQEELKAAMTRLVQQIKDQEYEQAKVEIPEFANRLKLIVGAAPQAPTVDLSAWRPVREQVMTKIKQVAKEIAAENHPQSRDAIIELQAVLSNLTAEPTSANQISELERYLEQDDVVLDVCELVEDIRTPLLRALGELKLQLAN